MEVRILGANLYNLYNMYLGGGNVQALSLPLLCFKKKNIYLKKKRFYTYSERNHLLVLFFIYYAIYITISF